MPKKVNFLSAQYRLPMFASGPQPVFITPNATRPFVHCRCKGLNGLCSSGLTRERVVCNSGIPPVYASANLSLQSKASVDEAKSKSFVVKISAHSIARQRSAVSQANAFSPLSPCLSYRIWIGVQSAVLHARSRTTDEHLRRLGHVQCSQSLFTSHCAVSDVY